MATARLNIHMYYHLLLSTVVTGVGCSVVSPPEHSMVSQTGIAADSEVNYSCQQGFTLTGNKSRLCSEAGLWTGSQPLCTGTCAHTMYTKMTLNSGR